MLLDGFRLVSRLDAPLQSSICYLFSQFGLSRCATFSVGSLGIFRRIFSPEYSLLNIFSEYFLRIFSPHIFPGTQYIFLDVRHLFSVHCPSRGVFSSIRLNESPDGVLSFPMNIIHWSGCATLFSFSEYYFSNIFLRIFFPDTQYISLDVRNMCYLSRIYSPRYAILLEECFPRLGAYDFIFL